MRRISIGLTLALAIAFAVPTVARISTAMAKTAAKGEDSASMSKEDQAKLKEHNKLRNEITKVKYPASKAEVVAKVKGIKADDKKWFEETLPDKTYSSSDDVMTALGWEATPAPDKAATKSKGDKAAK
jgi:hypothetical protein